MSKFTPKIYSHANKFLRVNFARVIFFAHFSANFVLRVILFASDLSGSRRRRPPSRCRSGSTPTGRRRGRRRLPSCSSNCRRASLHICRRMAWATGASASATLWVVPAIVSPSRSSRPPPPRRRRLGPASPCDSATGPRGSSACRGPRRRPQPVPRRASGRRRPRRAPRV